MKEVQCVTVSEIRLSSIFFRVDSKKFNGADYMQNSNVFDDREFFLLNPQREFRLRPALSGEISEDEFKIELRNENEGIFVLVLKITENERLRIPVTLIVESDVDDPILQSDDATCHELLTAISAEFPSKDLKDVYPIDIDTLH